ncbi:MAG: preprotein translocase subunit SecG [Proteobacteria bacterium]|nr:preprotein translocase subunit SecG [Pseudomonadota bacterium]
MWIRNILTFVQLISAAAIIGLVLLQRGKGADAGAGFGAGASGTVFGARGATTALSRATAIFAAIFMINSMGLAYLSTRAPAEAPHSILDDAASKPASLPATAPASPSGSGAPVTAPASTPAPANAPTPAPAAPK